MELFKLFGTIAINANDAMNELDDVSDKGEKTQSKLSGAFKKIGTAVAAGFAVGKIIDFGKSLVNLAENTREYRTEQAKLETAFEQGGFSADTARKTYEGLNAVLADSGRSVEAVNHLAKLVDTEEELSKWTDICTGVFATFGDSLPIEGLTEAANETAKVGQVTGPLADALNWAGVNEDAFNEKLAACSTEQERQAIITETLTDLYSEAAETYKETSGDVIAANKAQDDMNKVMAEFGAIIDPVITKGKAFIAKVLKKAIPQIKKFGEYIKPIAAEWKKRLKPVFDAIVDFVKTKLAPTIKNSFETIQKIVKKVFDVIVKVWESVLKPAFKAIKEFVENVLVPLFEKSFDKISGFVESAFETIKNLWNNTLKPVFDAIGWFLEDVLWPVFKKVFEGIATVVGTYFNAIKNLWNNTLKPIFQTIGDFIETYLAPVFSRVFNRIKDTISGVFDDIKWLWEHFLKPVFDGIVDFLTGVFTLDFKRAWEGIVEIVSGIWDGFVGIIQNPINKAIDLLNGLIDEWNDFNDKLPDDWAISNDIGHISHVGTDRPTGGFGGSRDNTSNASKDNSAYWSTMATGGVLERGQIGFLEGDGAEAVVPLENNKKWISAVARDMANAGVGGSGGTDNSEEIKKLREDFQDFVRMLPEMMVEAFASMVFGVNDREFARLVKAVK